MSKSAVNRSKKVAHSAKPEFVMVTFGVHHRSLGKQFFNLLSSTDQSASGLARELIARGMKNYPK
ncbi:hypothetical protein [Herbaspirillum sp. 1130]|uniref:hypothetical protein n=1 Tax=Herbaspirillum sp. 1130 TaxID=2806562 RepID=UPI001AE2B81B|nr:hypothetical protein [Herbaspirillum sp. 1130]MBP1314283.1 hypothetical protein [Herbaspirillum sp. 1130]